MSFDELIALTVCSGIFILALLAPIWMGILHRRSSALQFLATRYRGNVSSEHAFSRSKLKFTYGQSKVVVRYIRRMSAGGGPQTDIRMTVPLESLQLEVNCNLGKSRFWWSDDDTWNSGDPKFDGFFQCKYRGQKPIETILNETIRWQLLQILGLKLPGLYLSIDQGTLVMATRGYLTNKQRLDDFVRLCLEVYDQLMLAQAVGIDFVQDQTAVIDQVCCPICACDIQDKMVICVRCKTPHCLQCWKYNGKCATFACGETRFVYPVSQN